MLHSHIHSDRFHTYLIKTPDENVETFACFSMFFITFALYISDLTESVIPKWMFETGAVYLHGYDREGNKLCMYMFYYRHI